MHRLQSIHNGNAPAGFLAISNATAGKRAFDDFYDPLRQADHASGHASVLITLSTVNFYVNNVINCKVLC